MILKAEKTGIPLEFSILSFITKVLEDIVGTDHRDFTADEEEIYFEDIQSCLEVRTQLTKALYQKISVKIIMSLKLKTFNWKKSHEVRVLSLIHI